MAAKPEEEIEITLDMRNSLKESFDKHAGENEKLNKKQLARLLMEKGQARDNETAADMAKKYMSKFDKSGDSKMDFDEYIQYVGIDVFKAKKVKEDWQTETLRRVFKAADKDGSGYLTSEEIIELTDPVAFDLQDEVNEKFDFNKSMELLTTAAINFERSIGNQVVNIFKMFDKDGDGCLDKQEVKKVITMLDDLQTVFKRVDKVSNAKEGAKQSEVDAKAPIPKDGVLFVRDAVDLFTYYHFHRLEKDLAGKS